MGWKDAPAQAGSGDAQVDQDMAAIRQVGGQSAAEGKPTPTWQQAPPAEPSPEATQLPQDTSKTTSYRQGSLKDIQRPPDAPAQFGPTGPLQGYAQSLGDQRSSGVKRLDTGIDQYVTRPLEVLMGAYEDKVAGPVRRTMFKEDPLVTLERSAPGPDAPVGEHVWHALKTLGTGILSDPMTAIGAGGFKSLSQVRTPVTAPLTRLPSIDATSARPISDPLTRLPSIDPTPARIVPVPHQPPLAPIQDLAREATGDQLTQAQYAPRQQSNLEFPSLGTQPGVELNPQGSAVRPLSHPEDPASIGYAESALTYNSTGSMVRRTNPLDVTVAESRSPLEIRQPELPSNRRTVPLQDDKIPESRMLHGREPGLLTAEDLLARRQAEQTQRFQTLLDMRGQTQSVDLTNVPPRGPMPSDSLTQSFDLTNVPPRGQMLSDGLTQLAQAGPREAKLGGVAQREGLAQRPGPVSRFFRQAFDVLDETGQAGRRLSSILRYTFDYSEAGTKQNYLEFRALVERELGQQPLGTTLRKGVRNHVPEGLSHSILDLGVSQKQVGAILELLEHAEALSPGGWQNLKSSLTPLNIHAAVSPAAWKTLQAELLDPRIHRLVDEGWKLITGRASNLPSVQAKAMIHDFITGTDTPVGKASPYLPHQSIHTGNKDRFSHAHMKQMYAASDAADKGISFEVFQARFQAHLTDTNPDVAIRKYAGIENKRYINMAEDARAHNRTVQDSMKFYGYQTDPVSMLLTHNINALKRGVWLEHETEIHGLYGQLTQEFGVNSSASKWVKKVIERSQGLSEREDATLKSSDAWNIASSVLYPALLKGSWSQNFLLQPVHVFAQTGLYPFAKASWLRVGKKLGMTDTDIHASIERSAANFPSLMQKYHTPEGYFAQYAQAAMKLNLFSWSDQATRALAGETFLVHGEYLIRQAWKDPANPKWIKALEEGHLNTKELRDKMLAADRKTWDASGTPRIPPEMLQRYAQVMTNRQMGRTGVRSLPNWASGDADAQKIFMMLHRQIVSNEGAMWQAIIKAPTAGEALKRGLRYVAGAELAGMMYQGLLNVALSRDLFDPGESMTKAMGGHKDIAFVIKSLLLGAGTMSAGILLSGINLYQGNYGGTAYGIVSPPIAAFADDLFQKVVQGKVKETILKLQPSEIVDKVMKRREREDKARQRAPMPRQSLSTGVGLNP